jgi:hypothetical protein
LERTLSSDVNESPPGPPVLTYALAADRGPVSPSEEAHYWAAVTCGVGPLVAGTVGLLGFMATRWWGFGLLGLLALVVSPLAVAVGLADLAAYAVAERRRNGRLGAFAVRRVVCAAILLLAEALAGLACVAVGLRLLAD